MSRFNNLTGKLSKYKKEISLNKSIVNYLICIVIASILWFLNTLSQEYSTELSYPVKYINFPEDKYPVAQLPAVLQLNVQAKGFTLLGYGIRTSFLPITFNFNTYTEQLKERDGLSEYVLNTNDIKEKIGSQLSPDIKLMSVYPEQITFRFAPAKEKKVAIRPNPEYSLKRQYILNRITTVPDSVVVSGPANVIDTLQYVETEPWNANDLNKSVRKTLSLQEIENCHLREKNVDVTLEIEQFTEARRTIAILPANVPDSLNMRLFPAFLDITYEVGLSKYEGIADSDFTFTAEYPQDASTAYLEVKPVKVPEFIKNLNYTPQKVEYILEKK